MLQDSAIQISVPVADMARARQFYANTLGLRVVEAHQFGVIFDCAGTRLGLTPTSDAGKAGYSLVTWQVTDIDATMHDLRSAGITFEEYDAGPVKTVDGKAKLEGVYLAWFKDSEGNLLALVQPVT